MESMGNAFQLGASETWAIFVAPGKSSAQAARELSIQLHATLATTEPVDNVTATTSTSIERAFRRAVDAAERSTVGKVTAALGKDTFRVEALDSQHALDLAKHRVDSDLDSDRSTRAMDDAIQLLRDGLLTVDQYTDMLVRLSTRV
jgi:hypothetical protein